MEPKLLVAMHLVMQEPMHQEVMHQVEPILLREQQICERTPWRSCSSGEPGKTLLHAKFQPKIRCSVMGSWHAGSPVCACRFRLRA